jgi:hypothetical protein
MEIFRIEAVIALAGLAVLLFTLGACAPAEEEIEYDYSAYEGLSPSTGESEASSPMAMTGLPY